MAELTRRSRSILLKHADLALDRRLEPGDRVVLWDNISATYHSGRVIDLGGTPDDITYRFEIGIRLPDQLALARLAGQYAVDRPADGEELSTEQVIGLLGSLRQERPASVAAIPSSRQGPGPGLSHRG